MRAIPTTLAYSPELGVKLQDAASVTEILATVLFFPLLLLLCGSVFVAPMWNRRAGILRARRAAGFGV